MSVTIEGRSVHEFTDGELVAWLNDQGRGYRLREKTASLWAAILHLFDEIGPPMTVRQVFYALTTRGTVAKTQSGYNQIGYHLLQMRRRGVLPYGFISDNTRWMRKPNTYGSLEAYLKQGQRAYRRALWAEQGAYLEIWCEKDALAGVLYEVTAAWDVPLMVTRGFPSETFLYEAADNLNAQTKPAFLYFFGDHDPSGQNITESTEARLRGFGADFHFQQVAVLPWQIQTWGLPTRPTKTTDTRARNWKGGSVELDAVPANRLRQLAEGVITRHVNHEALEWTRRIEEAERKTFEQVVRDFQASPKM